MRTSFLYPSRPFPHPFRLIRTMLAFTCPSQAFEASSKVGLLLGLKSSAHLRLMSGFDAITVGRRKLEWNEPDDHHSNRMYHKVL